MKTKVVNVRDYQRDGHTRPYFIYCGRSMPHYGLKAHPLANPFRLRPKEAVDEVARAACLAKYREWLDSLTDLDEQLRALAEEVRATGLPLACWCSPRSCHCDVLAELIEDLL